MNCSRDADCEGVLQNAICSEKLGGICICNTWYDWTGPTCTGVDSPNALLILVVNATVAVLTVLSLAIASFSLCASWKKHGAHRANRHSPPPPFRLDQTRSRCCTSRGARTTLRKLNAVQALLVTCISSLCFLLVWTVFELASVLVVVPLPHNSEDNGAWSTLNKVTTYGRFEVVCVFFAPVALVLASMSVLRLALIWMEVAKKSRQMRPMRPMQMFSRSRQVLAVYFSVCMLCVIAIWALAFSWEPATAVVSIRVLFTVFSLPITAIVCLTSAVGAVNLLKVLGVVRKSSVTQIGNLAAAAPGNVFSQGNSSDDDRINNNRANRHSAQQAAAAAEREKRLSIPENEVHDGGDVAPGPALVMNNPVELRPAAGSVSKDGSSNNNAAANKRESSSVMYAGNAGMQTPYINGSQSHVRAGKWRRHSEIVRDTCVLIVACCVVAFGAMLAFSVLDFLYGWRDAPRIEVSPSFVIPVILFQLAPICVWMSQAIVLRYIWRTSRVNRMKTVVINNSSDTSFIRRLTVTFFTRRRSSHTPPPSKLPERHGSLVNIDDMNKGGGGLQQQAPAAGVFNPGFQDASAAAMREEWLEIMASGGEEAGDATATLPVPPQQRPQLSQVREETTVAESSQHLTTTTTSGAVVAPASPHNHNNSNRSMPARTLHSNSNPQSQAAASTATAGRGGGRSLPLPLEEDGSKTSDASRTRTEDELTDEDDVLVRGMV